MRPMVLSLLLVSAAASSSGAGPLCIPNTQCVPASKLPRDGEPGCKICVAPNSSYNCAACCPGYTMLRPPGIANVSYCSHAQPANDRPRFVERFSSMRTDDCGGTFPGCPADPSDPAGLVFTIFTAMDIPQQLTRVGPWSRLPVSENQVQISNSATGVQYNMWIDGSVLPAKVINCTRVQWPKQSVGLMRETWMGNFPTKPMPRGEVPCQTQKSGSCELWQWNSSFGVACAPGAPPKMGLEPERWLLGAPLPGANKSVVPLVAMLNDIHEPGCAGKPDQHRWYHSDWSEEFASPPDPGVFNVPSDADCPMMATTTTTVGTVVEGFEELSALPPHA
jgi:hypothetical protein